MFWLLPSSPSSISPSAEHSLKPVLPIGAPATAGADGAEGAAGAPAATVPGAAPAAPAPAGRAPPPMDAAEPGAGPCPAPGGGFRQPAAANNPTERVPTRSFV